MTVSNTDVIKEFNHLYKTFNLSKEDVGYYLHNSVDASFISKEEKNKMHQLVDDKLDAFYKRVIG